MSHPTPVSLVKAWEEAWTSSTLAADAHPTDVREIAEEWASANLPAEVAVEWAELGFCTPGEAEEWHLHGFTPRHADLVQNLIPFNSGGETFQDAIAQEAAWRTSGLSPRHVVLAVANDRSVSWMQAKVARGEMDARSQGEMALIAGLRGVDVQRLEIDWAALSRSRSAALLEFREK